MKKLFALLTVAGMLYSTSCSESYDDSTLLGRVDDLENRVARLEELCKQMNTNIASLQTLVTALQNNDYATGITPIVRGGETIGYTVTFTQSAPITIYCNENGNSAGGHTPAVGVRQDTDGLYYWTLDGEWLLDDAGNKIKAESRDGQDGTTPQLKIEEGYWYVSYDEGNNWTRLGKAVADSSSNGTNDSMFRSVDTSHSDYVLFTLSNGTEIRVPKFGTLAITFTEGNTLLFDIDETKTVSYTITGGGANNVVKAEMQNSDGNYVLYTAPTSATKGTIKITTKIPTANNVIISVSNGSQTIMTAISVSIKPSFQGNTIAVETPGTLSKLLADYDKSSITELTVIGNLNRSDIKTLKNLPNLAILDMGNVNYLEELNGQGWGNSLISLKLPRTLTSIGYMEFRNCSSLTDITIPNSVTVIGDHAFADCSSLTSITIPDGVTSIETGIFENCTSLTSVTIPDGVTSIGHNVFQGCSSLKSVTIPDGVMFIESDTFHGCSSLTSMTIPDSVMRIGNSVFNGCSSLTSVTIGNSVTRIENGAFSGCTNLTSIYCKAQTPPTLESNIFYDVATSTQLYVPIGSANTYRAATYWKNFTNINEMEF